VCPFTHYPDNLKAEAMWRQSSRAYCIASLAALCLSLAISPATSSDMADSVDMMWGNTQVLYDGAGRQMVSLSLDCWTTSAFRSKNKYLFGRFDIDIKLVPKDSAGTVTTIYVSNLNNKYD
jgi:xyloglucan:xyloglucosyl transferase